MPVAPVAVPVDGQRLLRYELHLANFASQPLAPTRIDVRDADSGAVIARIEGPALSRSLAIPGADPPGTHAQAIAQGMHGVVHLENTLPGQVPEATDPTIAFRAEDAGAASGSAAGDPLLVE